MKLLSEAMLGEVANVTAPLEVTGQFVDDLIPTEDELAAVGGGAHGASGGGSMPAGGGLVATASPITPIARKASTLLPPPDHVPPCTRLREIVVTQLFRALRRSSSRSSARAAAPRQRAGYWWSQPAARRPPRQPRFNSWRMAVDGCCGGCAGAQSSRLRSTLRAIGVSLFRMATHSISPSAAVGGEPLCIPLRTSEGSDEDDCDGGDEGEVEQREKNKWDPEACQVLQISFARLLLRPALDLPDPPMPSAPRSLAPSGPPVYLHPARKAPLLTQPLNDDSIAAAASSSSISTLKTSPQAGVSPTMEEIPLVHDGAAPAEVDGNGEEEAASAPDASSSVVMGVASIFPQEAAAVTIQAHARRRAQASRSQAQHDPTDSSAASLLQQHSADQQPPEELHPADDQQPWCSQKDHRRRHRRRHPRTHPRTHRGTPAQAPAQSEASIPEAADTIVLLRQRMSALAEELARLEARHPSSSQAMVEQPVAQPVDQGARHADLVAVEAMQHADETLDAGEATTELSKAHLMAADEGEGEPQRKTARDTEEAEEAEEQEAEETLGRLPSSLR